MLLLEAIDKGRGSFRRLGIAGSCVLATKEVVLTHVTTSLVYLVQSIETDYILQ
jgi:hypothetical protein